jgi:hypothetical protein
MSDEAALRPPRSFSVKASPIFNQKRKVAGVKLATGGRRLVWNAPDQAKP